MRKNKKQAIVICGLGYGDECKGSVTDYLARVHNAHTVIRYNGGTQAAHNVVLSDGRHHTFSQFGSASFIPGVRTHLSRFMLVNPIGMLIESEKLTKVNVKDALMRTTIDEQALIITPFHCSINRLRELARGEKRHGSCGQGVGETVQDAKVRNDLAIRASDLRNPRLLGKKLKLVQEFKLAQVDEIASRIPKNECAKQELSILNSAKVVSTLLSWYRDFVATAVIVPSWHTRNILDRCGTVLFEGAQGVLLDETHGFHPHVTWTNTTVANAETILRESEYDAKVTNFGLVRAYATRHGAGPFVTEDPKLSELLPDSHNGMHQWQRAFRVGWFDLVATRYALSVAGKIDRLAVSCIDRIQKLPSIRVCVGSGSTGRRFAYKTFSGRDMRKYLQFLQQELRVPITLTSQGPTERDKKFVRL